MYLTDVTVHVDETLQTEAHAQLEKHLRSLDGVTNVQSSKKTPHLVVVTYEPQQVKSRDILRAVQADHLHAQLIGL